jgi:hypothetical protein
MCWATKRNIELLTEFAQSHLRYYKHGTPNGVPPPEFSQMSKLQSHTSVWGIWEAHLSFLDLIMQLPMHAGAEEAAHYFRTPSLSIPE